MTGTYKLTCTACPFVEQADGLERSYDIAETHQQEHGGAHFVDMTLLAGEDGATASPETTAESGHTDWPAVSATDDLSADDD